VCIPKVLKQLQITDPEFGVRLDNHPEYLAAKNGLVCLRTKSLDPFIADSMVTRCLKTEYHPDTVCEKWVAVVGDMMGNDQEAYEYLRWMIGYALQGNPKEKLLFVLYGEHGSNGKTLLMSTIREVLGVYACPLDIDVFKGKLSGKASSHLVALQNRRIGYIPDADKHMTIQGGSTKNLTGGKDSLVGRLSYGDQMEVPLTVIPFICTNHILEMNLKSDSPLSDRLVVVPFENKYVKYEPRESYERNRDLGLADVFTKPEAQVGILAWLVDCGVYYHQNPGKQPTSKMNQYKQKFIDEQEE
jgi:putative DNA primase/helicase